VFRDRRIATKFSELTGSLALDSPLALPLRYHTRSSQY